METLLEFLHEGLNGMICAMNSYILRNFLNKKKTTQCRQEQKGGSRK